MSGLLRTLSVGIRARTSPSLLWRSSAANYPAGLSIHTTSDVTTGKVRVFEPTWEPGSGYYGDTMGKVGRRVVSVGHDLMLSYIDSVPVPSKKGVFTIGDYGTNDGYASMPLITDILKKLRETHGEELAIQVVYEDKEKNDFNSLFNRLHDTSSFLTAFDNIYVSATDTNFYKQCVPDGTFDFILSTLALHLFPKEGATLENGVVDFAPGVTEEERRTFRRLAADAWQNFLLLRAKELKPGGVLALLIASARSDCMKTLMAPDFKTGVVETPNALCDFVLTLDESWREMREKNVITQDEYRNASIPLRLRTPAEIALPFDEVNSPVREAGLSLLFHDQVVNPCMFKEMWQESKQGGVDDWPSVAEKLVKTYRIKAESLFHSSLSGMRSAEEKQAIVDQFYGRVQEKLTHADPTTLRMDMIVSRLVVQKSES